MQNKITVSAKINAPLAKAWVAYTQGSHICKWNFASDEWHCPAAEIDLQKNGKFNYRMEAKDGSFGFDFGGTVANVQQEISLTQILGDGREIRTTFGSSGDDTIVTQTFDAEGQHDTEMQRMGWQNILNNYKKYTETL